MIWLRLKDVAKATDLEEYVIRYWQEEFPELPKRKNRAGRLIFTNEDVRLVRLIKAMLRDERLAFDTVRVEIGKRFKRAEELQSDMFESAAT